MSVSSRTHTRPTGRPFHHRERVRWCPPGQPERSGEFVTMHPTGPIVVPCATAVAGERRTDAALVLLDGHGELRRVRYDQLYCA